MKSLRQRQTACSADRGPQNRRYQAGRRSSGGHMVSRLIRFIPKCSWSALVCQDFTMVGRQCSAPAAGEASNRPVGRAFAKPSRQAPSQYSGFCRFSGSKGKLFGHSRELTLTRKGRALRPRLAPVTKTSERPDVPALLCQPRTFSPGKRVLKPAGTFSK
jgi:hypothetical protein